MNLLVSLVVGLIAGALAGNFIRGRGFGLIGDTIVGLVGGLIGGIIFGLLGIDSSNILGSILISFVGAAVLLSLVKMIKTA